MTPDVPRKKRVSALMWLLLAALVAWMAFWAGQQGRLFRNPPPDNPAAATYGSNPAPKNENPNNLP